MIQFRRETIWNVDVQSAQAEEILAAIDNEITAGAKGRTLYCANPHSLVAAGGDAEFLNALRSADFLIPDGAGIVLASRLLGGTITRRVAGFDIFSGLAGRWDKEGGKSFYFLGSSEDVLEKITARMRSDYPNVRVCGTFAPPFKQEFSGEENDRMIDAVRRAAPTALWVGMTAPKQEKWIEKNRNRLDVPFIAAIGAAFDFFAGTRKRASAPLQNAGLEWLPRLLREPRRMWRRNFVSTPVFLYNILLQKAGML